MDDMEASTVANILVLVTEIIRKFGVPTMIHSGQGRQYDDVVERFNSTLVKMLSAYVDEHRTNWDQPLPYVMMAHRTAVHETTGCTPNRMIMGRVVVTTVDIMYELSRKVKSIPANNGYGSYRRELKTPTSLYRIMLTEKYFGRSNIMTNMNKCN
ncbi:unnamed protein product [Mytilus edulis]|uniref:Integrase catalytic domain-containing protein n=1 Tax=Mytilus edulis TaxID=6550 RepID=A0A8S3Q7Y0_MYTED|nr:unnamed protein product [Mytilus edulis]